MDTELDTIPVEMEILKADIRNCYALSLDKRIDEIIQLISDIEELLGLTSDKQYREERVAYFRQQSVLNSINPQLSYNFSVEVDNYIKILQEKKSILQSIFNCCNEFSETMKNELDHLNSVFSTNPSQCSSFVNTYNKKRDTTIPSIHHRQHRNRLPSAALSILWDFVRTHKNNPYPTNQQKEHLVRQTKLTMTQIRNWFTNTRKRKLNQTPESDEDYSAWSDGENVSPHSSISDETPVYRRRGRKHKSIPSDPVFSIPSNESPASVGAVLGGLTIDTSVKPQQDLNDLLPLSSPKTPSGTWIQYDQNTPRLLRGLSITNGRFTPMNLFSLRCTPRGDHDSLFDLDFADRPMGSFSPGSHHDLEFFINNEILPQYKKESAESSTPSL